jgi:hypothetical protein
MNMSNQSPLFNNGAMAKDVAVHVAQLVEDALSSCHDHAQLQA